MVNNRFQIVVCVWLPSALALMMPATADAQAPVQAGDRPSDVEHNSSLPSDSTEARESSKHAPSSQSWRVEIDDRPPYQVRRAVRKVRRTATVVASEIAGVDPANRLASPDRSEPADNREDEPTGDKTKRTAEIRILERETSSAAAESAELPSWSLSLGEEAGFFNTFRRLTQPAVDKRLELEPYIDDPRWREAMELLVEDDCREALDIAKRVLEEQSFERRPAAIDYAVGRIEMCAGESGDGRGRLRALADGEGAVARLASRRLGASPAPIEERGGGATSMAARIRQAQRAAAGGEFGEALEQLADLRKNLEWAWQRYQVRMAEAEMFLHSGKLASAARRFLGIYEMTRDWNIGDRIAEKIARIEREYDIEIVPFAARVDRMRELIDRGRYRKARRVSIQNAQIAGVSGDEIEGWAAYRKGLQAEREHDRRRADRLFERAERLVDSPVIRSRIYYGWARALRRLDRDREAIALYERLCREYPRHRLCDDARYQAGRLLQYLEEHKQARAKFAELVGLHPNSEHVASALWLGAFSAYLMGDYEAMDEPLQRLRDHYGDGTDASGLPLSLKARYWLGTAAFKRGDLELARRRFQATINHGPLTWYGRLAAARMKRIGEQPIVPRPPSVLTNRMLKDLGSLAIPRDERLKVAAEYARLGLYEDAIDELERQIDAAPAPDKTHQFLATVKLLAGEVHEAHWEMAQRIEDQPTPTIFDLRDWGLAYPVDFLDLAHKYGNRYSVSPFAIEGVIRQESGFRPAVRSWVGAVGLMQLMPGTGNSVSDRFLDGEYMSRSELSQPETNIKLGTIYLRVLTGYVRGRLPMALAGYNAGPAPLDSWFRRYGDREIDAWVESITYRQARGYTRKVYTNYVRYAALYGGRLPTPKLEPPESFGDWGEVPELQQTEPRRPISMLRTR